jgi:pimeloyl-ACP methyl ester carboxylesterase
MSTTIYCISGLGADEKAFSKLAVPGYQLHCLPWLLPEPNEPIAAYARRMLSAIPESNPILMGLSFGGMMCIEIAQQIPVHKVILISSVKTRMELPRWMKWAGKLRLHKVIPLKSSKITEPLQNYNLGVTNEEERQMAAAFRRNVDIRYTNWAIHQVLTWRNTRVPENLYHIHGDKDRMFPLKKLTPDYTIENGGHFMILNKAEEISSRLTVILQNPSHR